MSSLKQWSLIALISYFMGCNGQNMEPKIVGGEFADIRNFPHAVFTFADCENKFSCGASVLNQRILLTAAHCVYSCTGKYRIDAFAGSSSTKKPFAINKVRRYIIHEDYDDDDVFCDIALMVLNGNLPLGKHIKRVILLRTFPSDAVAEVAGWGITSETGSDSVYLKHVKQKVWKNTACHKYETMLQGAFCAASGSRTDYPLSGDSGSGLVTETFQIIGLVSYRGSRKDLIIYTNVSYFYKWIARKTPIVYCANKGK